MTTLEIVDLLKGKPSGQNRWFARCPVHSERSASLSIRAGNKSTLLYCFGCHAKSAQIMGAIGLTAAHCFYNSGQKMTREQRAAYRQRMRHQERWERLQDAWARSLWAWWALPKDRPRRRLVEMYRWAQLRGHEQPNFDDEWAKLEQSGGWASWMAEVAR